MLGVRALGRMLQDAPDMRLRTPLGSIFDNEKFRDTLREAQALVKERGGKLSDEEKTSQDAKPGSGKKRKVRVVAKKPAVPDKEAKDDKGSDKRIKVPLRRGLVESVMNPLEMYMVSDAAAKEPGDWSSWEKRRQVLIGGDD